VGMSVEMQRCIKWVGEGSAHRRNGGGCDLGKMSCQAGLAEWAGLDWQSAESRLGVTGELQRGLGAGGVGDGGVGGPILAWWLHMHSFFVQN
jgi:hypothetical protein